MEEFSYEFINTKYVIIRINNVQQEIFPANQIIDNFLSCQILNFDPNSVKIPKSNYEFYLSSAVLYNSSSKHYTCVRKVSEGVWVEISDTTCKFNNSFWKTLKNVHIIK